MITIFAFIDGEFRGMVVVLRDEGGHFGFFTSGVADFLMLSDPTFLREVGFG